MAIYLTWDVLSQVSDGQRLYRSTEPFDLENMPEAYAELGPAVDLYTDPDEELEDGQLYYYAVGAYVGEQERFSNVTSITAVLGQFNDPTIISGCVLWLDALDFDTQLQNGDPVPAWEDKSGMEHDFVQSESARRPLFARNYSTINGNSLIHFNAANNHWLRNDQAGLKFDINEDDFTIFWVGLQDASPFTGTVFAWREDSNNSYQTLYQPSSRASFLGGGVSMNTEGDRPEEVLIVTSAIDHDGECVQRINGVTQLTVVRDGQTQSNIPDISYPVRIGARGNNAGGIAYVLTGYLGELIVYNRKLGAGDIIEVEDYLLRKWRNAEPLAPDQISGLFEWWDAASLTGLDDGDPVTTWNDSGPNEFTATRVSGADVTYVAEGMNGHPAVLFANDGQMDTDSTFAATTSNIPFTLMLITKHPVQNHVPLVRVYHAGVAAHGFRETGTQMSNGSSPLVNPSAHAVDWIDPDKGNVIVVQRTANNSSGQTTWRNGAEVPKLGNTARWAESNPARIGSNYIGEVYEIALFNRELTLIERERLELYARQKYNLEF